MRKRSNFKKDDDRRFRIRIKFAPPRGGIRRYTEIHLWLQERFGHKGFALWPVEWDGGGMDAFAVHIDDPSAVDEVCRFVENAMNDPFGGHVFGKK